MSPLALLTKLAAMLRNVPAVQFVFAKFAALLRSNKSSGEPLISDFLGEAPAVNRNMADDDVDVSKPSSNRAIAAPETIDQSDVGWKPGSKCGTPTFTVPDTQR
jgi:hypothetical protein